MGVTYVKEVMSPEELLSEYALPEAHKQLKAQRDQEIAKVFTGESDKFLVIIGPCSADNEDSVCDYISRLVKVQDKVKSAIESMTGMEVSEVNVRVAGVELE